MNAVVIITDAMVTAYGTLAKSLEEVESRESLVADPGAMAHLEQTAERVYREAVGEPWKAREGCFWRRAVEALAASQQPMYLSLGKASHGRDQLILTDHQGNQVVAMNELDEREHQERWLNHSMLATLDQLLGKIARMASPEKLALLNMGEEINVFELQDMFITLMLCRERAAHQADPQHAPDLGSGLDVVRQLSVKTMEEAREHVVALTGARLRRGRDLAVEYVRPAIKALFDEQQLGATEDELKTSIERVETAVMGWHDAVARLVTDQVVFWRENHKNEEK